MRPNSGQAESCRSGDHEACIRTVYPERDKHVCSCSCHKISSMRTDHKPTSRDPRVRTRHASWYQHWWLAAFPGDAKEYTDESIIREPLSKEELWKRQFMR